MFIGKYPYNLDDRGRVVIPPRYRDAFKAGLVLAIGIDPCITLYSPDGWTEFTQRLEALSFTNEDARRLRRSLYSNAFPGELDRQGRVLLSSDIREYAGIAQEVMVVGSNDHLELWAKDRWLQEEASLPGLVQIAARLNA